VPTELAGHLGRFVHLVRIYGTRKLGSISTYPTEFVETLDDLRNNREFVQR
jgi:hypothetical protein